MTSLRSITPYSVHVGRLFFNPCTHVCTCINVCRRADSQRSHWKKIDPSKRGYLIHPLIHHDPPLVHSLIADTDPQDAPIWAGALAATAGPSVCAGSQLQLQGDGQTEWTATWKTAHSERFQNPALVMREAKWTDTSSTRVVRDGFGTREKHREHMQVMAEEYELPLPPCTDYMYIHMLVALHTMPVALCRSFC